ncbi:MAG: UDP-2,3-diacylglucosamine diphosphatase LpxI [Candidatus Rokuibacteriota bacterium]
MERQLGLMAGAGTLPARAAAEARRQGWRVLAFAFDHAPTLDGEADTVIPSSLTDVQAVLSVLQERRVEAVLFAGKLAAQSILDRADALDEAGHRIAAGGLSDSALTQMVLATFGAMGIEVLDQRRFLGPHLFSERSLAARGLTSRPPTESEWEEVRAGVMLARTMASQGIGQTVVRARGVTVAVEAAEGTDDTIRRGTRLAGPGAVVVKAVAPAHDFRFDVPAVGPATLQVMAAGRARVLAVERGNVLLADPAEVVRIAGDADIAVVGVGADGERG